MDATTIINLLIQIGGYIVKYGPEAFQDAEAIWNDLTLAYASITSGTPLTLDQQAQYDQVLATASTKFDVAVAARAALEAQG